MGRAGRIARRTLLVGGAAIAGGVAFGVWRVRTPYANPLDVGLADGEATFNPWVKVTADRIVLVTPHADLGQGTAHMQALLIAEEMDLEPGQFETDFGVPAPAYWNRGMAAEVAPFTSDDRGLTAEATRTMLHSVFKVLGIQATGGSSSVPDSFDKLREAGAVARETLKAAAFAETGVAVDRLRTAAGKVILPGGDEIPYTALAARAATLEPVTDVVLRPPSAWRLIGAPSRRLDIPAKSTGTQAYGIDLVVEGMVHAVPRTNPRRGPMRGYDAAAALAMRGVLQVVEVDGGVAVVADNTWRAMRAASAVKVDWGPAPYPPEQATHWDRVAASFGADQLDREWRALGDVDAAMAAGTAVTAEYRAGYAGHAPLEPLNAVVRVGDGGVEVFSSHQMPRIVQQVVAEATGVDRDAVTYHNQYAGGSFGHRLEFDHLRLAAQVARAMPGTPVKLTFPREEDFLHDYPRQIGMARGRAQVADGRVTAVDLAIATTSASRSQLGRLGMPVPGPDIQIAAGSWNAPYALPDFRVRAYAVEGLAPTSSWRSVGAVTSGFFGESLLDEAIHAAGADPLEERLRLLDDPRASAVLQAVGEMSRWGRDPGPDRGLGLALVESFGVMTAEVVEVEMTERGIRLRGVWAAAEVGTVVDPVNFESQVQGGIVWGLGHAMNCEITYSGGMAQQTNYHDHAGMRMYQCPPIEVRGIAMGGRIRGIGEPPVPPAAPALANAIFAATGRRIREMPMHRHIDFV